MQVNSFVACLAISLVFTVSLPFTSAKVDRAVCMQNETVLRCIMTYYTPTTSKGVTNCHYLCRMQYGSMVEEGMAICHSLLIDS